MFFISFNTVVFCCCIFIRESQSVPIDVINTSLIFVDLSLFLSFFCSRCFHASLYRSVKSVYSSSKFSKLMILNRIAYAVHSKHVSVVASSFLEQTSILVVNVSMKKCSCQHYVISIRNAFIIFRFKLPNMV